jgi:hypothetical protein
MAGGLSAEAAAAKIGISARSLFYWQQDHPEFLQAIQEGRQKATLWWEERAIAMAKGRPGNAQIVMLALRNRSRAPSGWSNDTVKLEHSGPKGPQIDYEHVIPVKQLTREERDGLQAFLLTQLTEVTDLNESTARESKNGLDD